jgi:formylglycine-generating enzyme required for sulfatase activity
MGLRTASCALAVSLAGAVFGQVDPLGLQFVTVGSAGNPAYQASDPRLDVHNRGAVAYEYRIGQYELTTAQWCAFFNAAYDRPVGDGIPFIASPLTWGAVPTTPNTPGARRWSVPAGNEMRFTGGVSWRTAAIFCNWLCNGANPNAPRSDFLNGAYDVSTFGYNGSIFTDQAAHNPGAAYWIPTWDEWLKASHWSPNNPANGGWHTYSNGSDSPYTYGVPGVGQANAGLSPPNSSIPLGAYAPVQSPWGLFDVAGGTQEWTESILTLSSGTRFRYLDGSYWNEGIFQAGLMDGITSGAGEFPHVDPSNFGFRIASAVPSPSTCALAMGMFTILSARRRR